MKRTLFVCLFQFLTITFLLSQSNSVPLINQDVKVVPSIPASKLRSGRFHAAARRAASAQAQGPIFAPAVVYNSGSPYPVSVAVGDVNGDGKPDVIVANNSLDGNEGSVNVFLGKGDGTIQGGDTWLSGGQYATSVVVADVNGDGKPDLLVANLCADSNCDNGSVGVLLGNGDGTFQTPVTYSSGGGNAESLAVVDLNKDGRLDLVVANRCASSTNCTNGSVGVLLGNGDGTFAPAVTYNSGGENTESVAVGDFNGDGIPDLAVASDGAGSGVGILLGNGDGTFQAVVGYSGGSSPNAVAVGDFNGDGKLDLAVANGLQPGTVDVLLGNGDGTFAPAVAYNSGGETALSVAVGDVNGDGIPDLLVSNLCNNLLSCNGVVGVLLGNGDGTFQTAVAYGSGGQDGGGVAVADLNGGSALDLVVVNSVACGTCFTGSVGVLLNVSSGSTATTTAIASSSNPSVFGQPVTFTATVTGQGSVTPTGTVTFYNSTATLGTGTLNGSGVATYTTSSLAAGQYLVTATYGGDASNFGSSSSVLTQAVNAASFSVAPNPTSATVMAGQSATFTVTVTPQGLFNSPISFSCIGLPAMAGCTFNPASVTPNSSPVTSTLIITTTAQNASLANPFRRGSNPLYAMWLLLPAMLLGTAGTATPNRRKLLSYCLAFLLVGGCLLQVACSSGSNGSSGGGGTPAGTYTITVIGAAGSTQYMTTVKTTVQ